MVVARRWEDKGMGSNCLLGVSPFGKMKQVLEMDGGDGHPTTGMYLMLFDWTGHLKMVKMVNLRLCMFYNVFLNFHIRIFKNQLYKC